MEHVALFATDLFLLNILEEVIFSFLYYLKINTTYLIILPVPTFYVDQIMSLFSSYPSRIPYDPAHVLKKLKQAFK